MISMTGIRNSELSQDLKNVVSMEDDWNYIYDWFDSWIMQSGFWIQPVYISWIPDFNPKTIAAVIQLQAGSGISHIREFPKTTQDGG